VLLLLVLLGVLLLVLLFLLQAALVDGDLGGARAAQAGPGVVLAVGEGLDRLLALQRFEQALDRLLAPLAELVAGGDHLPVLVVRAQELDLLGDGLLLGLVLVLVVLL